MTGSHGNAVRARSLAALPSAAADPLSAGIEALVERVLDRAVDRFAELLATQPATPKVLLTDDEIAVALGVSVATLRRVLVPGGLPHLRVGDVRRYELDVCIAHLRASSVKP